MTSGALIRQPHKWTTIKRYYFHKMKGDISGCSLSRLEADPLKKPAVNKFFWACLLLFAAALGYFIFSKYAAKEKLPPLTVQTFQGAYGWGYRILAADTVVIIEQAFIPGIEGHKGFESEEKARWTGDLVRRKIEKGEFPPFVTSEELEKLGVL